MKSWSKSSSLLASKPIALSAVFSLVLSLFVFMGITPAKATTNVEVVVHVPLSASESEVVTITPDGGTQVTASAKYADDYGSFAVLTIPAEPADVAITATGLPSTGLHTRTTKEIWLDGAGIPHPSRFQAQDCTLDVHYLALSNGDATGADLNFNEDGGTSVGLITTSSVSGTTATFTYEGTCNAKKVVFSAKIGGTDKTEFEVNLRTTGEVWIKDSWPLARTSQEWANGYAVIHWYRAAGYDNYGLHTWSIDGNGYSGAAIGWESPMAPTGEDAWGKYWRLPIYEASTYMPYIIHSGNSKDPSDLDQMLDLEKTGGEVWLKSGSRDTDGFSKYTVPVVSDVEANLLRQKAIWLTPTVIAWPTPITASEYDGHAILYYSHDANLETDDAGVQNADDSVVLEYAAGLSKTLRTQFPHLQDYVALKVPTAEVANVSTWVRGQVAIEVLKDDKSGPLKITGVQLGDVLDALYPDANSSTLGVTWNGNVPTIRVWAPTAQSVTLNLYDDSDDQNATEVSMSRNDSTGVWSATGDSSWNLKQYTFRVGVYAPTTGRVESNEVSDPYSISLNINGERSQVVNLDDNTLKPTGWDAMVKPQFRAIADASIYELMIRDFSIIDETVPEEYRGGYLAFTQTDSDGMQHLADLADAGLTHLQIGPAFDIATVDEDKSNWSTLDWATLEGYASNSTSQRTAVNLIKDSDGFNWGYDPLHYTAPDGSFSIDPDSDSRILEFRSMVKGLNDIGLRTSMDVVYNHTSADGQSSNSVLDRVVPGYYHRLNASGSTETSTCCKNTATERMMMAKLNIDSVLTWATEYKIDGFRFDLMGHQPKAEMEAIRAALDALTIANDGVDGKKILLYGEGWNFGEVASNAHFPNATQANMDGTLIGTFDDRIRDSVRGGSPFDGDPRKQGFASGLYGNWNGWSGSTNTKLAKQINMDAIKISLTGALSNYRLMTYKGINQIGQVISNGGAIAGYTDNPVEQIAYADAHDNETLYDALAYKLPTSTSMADRVRYQLLGLAVPTMGQGLPFVLAGTDLLRSKSMDKNSYNAGDWYNAIDWTLSTNGFGRGLPIEVTNSGQATSLLGMSSLVPTADDMNMASDMWQDLLKVRYSSKLFRLGTGAAVSKRVKFLTAGPKAPIGLIAMRIVDFGKGIKNIDPTYKSIVVVINASKSSLSYTATNLKTAKMSLHPVLKTGADSVVKTAKFSKGKFTIPALTTAVFVEK